ncbi:MAG: serine dehydratase beta chain, partial [Pseudomonadota bacterium]
MFLSVFDLFKIGVGPSSSHTMGPMVAARRFLHHARDGDWPRPASSTVHRIKASLHGSLAFTGKGHSSDRAVVLGLMGCDPATLDPDAVEGILERNAAECVVDAEGFPQWTFNPSEDLIFDYDESLPGHANGMRFSALDEYGQVLVRQVYYSVGGGFVVDEMELERMKAGVDTGPAHDTPHPFATAREMLEMAARSGKSIAGMKRENELAASGRSAPVLGQEVRRIWEAMDACVKRGLSEEGELPGGLFVKRRAKKLAQKLDQSWKDNMLGPLAANDWLSVFAMAVNEANAAGGKVVTAPTNGAAG